MTGEDMAKAVAKALEVWTLQNLFNISIMLGILATGLAMVQGYYRALEKRLSLRVSVELWGVLTILLVDVLLAIVVLVGYLVLNPDIMADIKIGIPFCPVATVLYAIALVLRLFHGGHDVTSKNYLRSLYWMFAAGVINVIGFTFVMEAPSKDYLKDHPSEFWNYLKMHLRSNANLEWSQITFYICFAALIVVLIWGAVSALRQIRDREP